MDGFESSKSARLQGNSLSLVPLASAPLLSERPIRGYRHSFQSSPIPPVYGFSIEDIPNPSHHSVSYDPPGLPLHPHLPKCDPRPACHGHGPAAAQSVSESNVPPYQTYSHLVPTNFVTTNEYLKTCSPSNVSKYSFGHSLTRQSGFFETTSSNIHMIGDSRQHCQEHQIPQNTSLVADPNHYSHKLLDPYKQPSQELGEDTSCRKQLDSQKIQEKQTTPEQPLVTKICASENTHDSAKFCATSSLSANHTNNTTSTGMNDIFSKLTTAKAYFKCGICELKLTSNEALLGHINTHTDFMPYSCGLCGASFVEGRQLMRHVQHSHSVKPPYACGLCKKTFYENFELEQHVLTHKGDKGVADSGSEISLAKDKRDSVNLPTRVDGTINRDNSVFEDIENDNCEAEFDKDIEADNVSNGFNTSEFDSMPSNTIVISKDTRFDVRKEPSKIVMDDVDIESVCTVIVEPSTAGGIRKKHLFKCNFCEKVCKDKGSLVSHVRTHTKARPYKCHVCLAKFKQYAHLSDHMITKHSKDRPYVCDRCAKSFNRKSHLQDHIRLKHTEDKLYHCTECPLTFQKRAEFSEHKRTHGKTLKYKCNMCTRQFRNVTDYERHIRSHTKEKLYECEICHLKFGLLANAKKHMIKHNKERPFKCDICPKSYHFAHDLKRHKVTHMKKKAFPCPDCYKSFKNSALLKKHVKTAHENPQLYSPESFQCVPCKKYFKTQVNLEKHLKTHKPKKVTFNSASGASYVSEEESGHTVESQIDKTIKSSSNIEVCYAEKESAMSVIVGVEENENHEFKKEHSSRKKGRGGPPKMKVRVDENKY
ncbi:zinc finger protein 99 [Elysia marginata]|uniref:Zinc finger protein 99 n=1 Tax=Elysia marginata TaxID=1093978 RepID=A0AAV4HFG0_9GAST|nr:zinc finger protein 99 [Elysia marginata]